MSDNFDSQFDDDLDEDLEDENPVEEPEDDFDDQFEEDSFEEEEDFEEDESFEEDGESSGEEDEEYDKPVSEGETVEVEVEDLGSKGDGIARVEGFVVFVPGGEVGESYEVEITSVGRKFAFAEIQE